MAYTRGPWTVVLGGMDAQVRCPDGRSFVIGDIVYHEENKANATLIAAAPEMYEALKRVVRDVTGWDGDVMDIVGRRDCKSGGEMTGLNQTLAAITGLRDPLHEADNVVPFPTPPPAVDPMHDSMEAITTARWNFEFAVIEAFNAGDVQGLTQLLSHIQKAADGLLVVETMARDFTMRMQR